MLLSFERLGLFFLFYFLIVFNICLLIVCYFLMFDFCFWCLMFNDFNRLIWIFKFYFFILMFLCLSFYFLFSCV
ncbi:hypothetical protein EWZ76_01765 [Helicobacter pylori]|nr:hypothetical protein [Helicobacter pylori]